MNTNVCELIRMTVDRILYSCLHPGIDSRNGVGRGTAPGFLWGISGSHRHTQYIMCLLRGFFDMIMYGVLFLGIACGFGYLISLITVPGMTQ